MDTTFTDRETMFDIKTAAEMNFDILIYGNKERTKRDVDTFAKTLSKRQINRVRSKL